MPSTRSYEIAQQTPTLGDMCDLVLVRDSRDPFAIARLLSRWLVPKPTVDTLRDMLTADVVELLELVIKAIDEHGLMVKAMHSGNLKVQ